MYNQVSEKLASVTARYDKERQELIQLHDKAQAATNGVLSEIKEIGHMVLSSISQDLLIKFEKKQVQIIILFSSSNFDTHWGSV